MHWLRFTDPFGLLLIVLVCALFWAGGTLLAAYTFRLAQRERLLVGLALGWLLWMVFSNLLANLLPLTPALIGGSLLTLGGGLLAGWGKIQKAQLLAGLRVAGPQLLALAGLLTLFALMNRGLAIFDDYHNLPLVSTLAAGDAPPHFYLNWQERLAYHYGLNLFAAMLVRLGGFFPWGAFDLSKALASALTVLLAGLWFRRATGSAAAGRWGALLAWLAGGARWLLLFAPVAWLQEAGKSLTLLGSAAVYSPDLYTALLGPWKIEGGGPIAFPFAFVNGIFPPLSFALGGGGALPHMTLILLLLLARPKRPWMAGATLGLVLASLALSAEHLLVLMGASLGIALLYGLARRAAISKVAPLFLGLGLAVALSATTGGVLTELVRGLLQPAAAAAGFTGFGLRWPPQAISAHLGLLPLTNPRTLWIALVETGPVLLLGLWALPRTWKQLQRGGWLAASLGLAALLGLLLPLFVQYLQRDRDITRLAATALFTFLLLGFPAAWKQAQCAHPVGKFLLALGTGIALVGGLFSLPPQVIAIAAPQFSYFITEPDALMAKAAWNKLEPEAQVFDRLEYRSASLLGRGAGRAYADWYTPFPEWEQLAQDFDPRAMARAGYDYLYLDKTTWQELTLEQKSAFQDPCLRLVQETTSQERDYRRLFQISACR